MTPKGLCVCLLVLTCLFSANAYADSFSDTFGRANTAYRNGQYKQAAELYETLIEQKPAATLFYNCGNAYFRGGKIGRAILNYQRALRLNPRDKDVKTNLNYAERSIEYEIKDKRNWYAKTISHGLEAFTLAECWFVALAVYFVFILSLMLKLIAKKDTLFGKLGWFGFVILGIVISPLVLKYSSLGSRHHAIVTQPEAEVRYGPSRSDSLALRLVEGLEISVRGDKEDWYRIELNDGQAGWVLQSQVDII